MENTGKRLNKYISDAGICSRREADRLIEAGRVEIKRKTRKDEPEAEAVRAHVGDRVYSGDTVYVNGRELPKKEPDRVYYLYNKPAGVICTTDRDVPENIIEAAGIPQHVTYAGRLDKDSSGLIILTNDGALIDRMMRASSYHEKQYSVTVDKPVSELFLDEIRSGVKIHIDDEETLRRHPNGLFVTTRPCYAKQTGERRFEVILTQGYNRQIRRMCSALGYTVSSITRERVMNLTLGDLKAGSVRKMTRAEVEELMRLSKKQEVVKSSARELKSARKAAMRHEQGAADRRGGSRAGEDSRRKTDRRGETDRRGGSRAGTDSRRKTDRSDGSRAGTDSRRKTNRRDGRAGRR